MKTKLFILLFLSAYTIPTLFFSQLKAQIIQPRLNQGAVLEPPGKIINGAGQDLPAFMNYWNVMHTQNKPLIYMSYINLSNVTSDWAEGLKADLMSNAGKFKILQVGLAMTVDGTPSAHYEQDVAAGLYDDQISMFIDGLQSLAIPSYVRIGYEFNGTVWNGYEPATYKNAFLRITNMIRARGIEAATVWDLAMDGAMNFEDFYPGDAYVDWWAINLFSATHFTDPNAQKFLDGARDHAKPVMIGETTPRSVGVLNGQQSWDQWFSPFFTFIHTHPEIKAFCYINWNWSQYPQWQDWGDARLEQNAIVGNNFAGEMDSLQYLHASTEQTFRQLFGSSDKSAPAIPGTISVVQLGYPLILNWDTVTDPSGLSHYIVYKHGDLSDYTLTLPYSDKSIAAGDTITYAVSAMDRAGNESQATDGLQITVPSTLSKLFNGDFDSGTQNWHFSSVMGASAIMEIDTNALISGRNSCAITTSQLTGTNWHIQLWQWAPIKTGRKYKITFKAKASSSTVIDLVLQQAASPYAVYLYKEHTIGTAVKTFTDEVLINTTDQAKLEFMFGTSGPAQIWIDSVSIIESYSVNTDVVEPEGEKSEAFALLHNYPNPFNTSTTIGFRVTENGLVSLKVFDVTGREVVTLVNERKSMGEYSIEWNTSGLVSGIYFCKLQNGSCHEVKKMQLLK